jgi:RNA polymerase sigma-70 factor (ECF subfamily)
MGQVRFGGRISANNHFSGRAEEGWCALGARTAFFVVQYSPSAVSGGNVESAVGAIRVLPSGAGMDAASEAEFDRFVDTVRPRLVRALVGAVGVNDAADAAADAIAYAFEHWDRIQLMDNPAGYLYRVGQSRARRRRAPELPPPASMGLPDIEPGLVPALRSLPTSQRTAVWLVHACGWHYSEVAEAMETSTSMVGNHVSRGLDALRRKLGVTTRA